MVGIFERIGLLVKANVTDLLDSFEDPELVARQALADAKVEYARMRNSAAPVFANERQASACLDELRSEVEKWHTIASRALVQGNEGDARDALSVEVAFREQVSAQEAICASARASSEKMRMQLHKVEGKIRALEARISEISAKVATVCATEAANRVVGEPIGGKARDALSRLDLETERKLAETEAFAELSREFRTREDELSEMYGSDIRSDVDDAFAALKVELAE